MRNDSMSRTVYLWVNAVNTHREIYSQVKAGENCKMDPSQEQEAMRRALQRLVDARFGGSKAALSRASGIDATYISRLLSKPSDPHHKNFGLAIIEKIRGVDPEWYLDERTATLRELLRRQCVDEDLIEGIHAGAPSRRPGAGVQEAEQIPSDAAPVVKTRKVWLIGNGQGGFFYFAARRSPRPSPSCSDANPLQRPSRSRRIGAVIALERSPRLSLASP